MGNNFFIENREFIINSVYFLLALWFVVSVFLIAKLAIYKNLDQHNPYIYEAIPSVFTTIGVLGTFVGIYFGLIDFNVYDINSSIPTLLEGLKHAFSTSIVGIVLSLIFSKISEFVLFRVEKRNAVIHDDNYDQKIIEELKELNEVQHKILSTINERDTHIDDVKDYYHESIQLFNQIVASQNRLEKLQTEENQIITNTQEMMVSQHQETMEKSTQFESRFTEAVQIIHQMAEHYKEQNKLIQDIAREKQEILSLFMIEIKQKFEEFSELLSQNNTEALVSVMEKVTEEFNQQMNTLISRLVQENFEQLNHSVMQLNQWQQENKAMIASLTEQFNQAATGLDSNHNTLKEITHHTEKLVSDAGYLQKLISELQRVIIDDNKFEKISTDLSNTADLIKKNTNAFDETTNKLNKWVENQMYFSDSVERLLSRLEEIDKIKDINEIFWKNTKEQMNEGVNLLHNASESLAKDLDTLNQTYQDQLNNVLMSLDMLIQRIIINYDGQYEKNK
ncbi:hypothetical protein [Basilea psittacipulmonis]|uniref:MotA/TolQ/ExbB proton channel domain-containing protein n=1 Tax=Basilea psittacipulmonis DSM 24701 TaxID=1072685 RepID=A0A077DCU7_9BURK|nr:hypothetical protein [Basilea psittacipulmonis]AIL32429.1 hypothetical protein IX83_03090 [Basilea psittacipulmonis DSM 24701]